MSDLEHLARQAMCVMVLDLEYHSCPLHGHAPIRHQLLWVWAEEALGDKFAPLLEELLETAKTNGPIKTNPGIQC